MADKPVTVAVPEERVPGFYVWFAHFLATAPGSEPSTPAWGPPRGGPRGRGGGWRHGAMEPWTPADADAARWLYRKLAPLAQELLDLLLDEPGRHWPGNALAERLGLEKGAHGVAGILAWPGATAASSAGPCRSRPRSGTTAGRTTGSSRWRRSSSAPRAPASVVGR